jgi:HAD superfamily hydrolase (TIGR01509 family)
MSFDCFIFDFDGTVARSEHAYLHSFKHSIKLHTGLEVSEEEFRKYWHMNFTPEDILREYGEEMVEEMVASFEEHYYENHLHHLDVYEGIRDLLENLERQQTKLGLVSLKPRRAGRLELESVALQELFRVQVWGDDVENVKPAPDGVHQALDALQARPERTLVIGDSAADILMGRAAGTLTAAAMWGSPRREKLLATSPDFVIDAPADLLKLF